MRVSTDPTDQAYINDRPRKVWCNNVEIDGWTVADEFRRIVVTPEKVFNGAVRIERLPEDATEAESPAHVEPPLTTGFSGGVFEYVPDPPKAGAVAVAERPAKPKAKSKHRR